MGIKYMWTGIKPLICNSKTGSVIISPSFVKGLIISHKIAVAEVSLHNLHDGLSMGSVISSFTQYWHGAER